jgi:O-antigen ligase
VSYLTLLARYGVLGTVVYMAFLIWPLWTVWRRGVPMAPRYFVTMTLGTLMVVYLGYDILLFFEIQYLFFGLVYAVAVQVTAAATMTPPLRP